MTRPGIESMPPGSLANTLPTGLNEPVQQIKYLTKLITNLSYITLIHLGLYLN